MLFVSFLSIDNIINELSRKVNRRNILSADYSAIRFIFWWKRSLNSNIPQSEKNTIIQRKNTSLPDLVLFQHCSPFVLQKRLFDYEIEPTTIIGNFSVEYTLPYIFIQRSVGGAGAVVLPFFVHSKRVPCGGAVNVFLFYVVHTHGNTEHRTHCD